MKSYVPPHAELTCVHASTQNSHVCTHPHRTHIHTHMELTRIHAELTFTLTRNSHVHIQLTHSPSHMKLRLTQNSHTFMLPTRDSTLHTPRAALTRLHTTLPLTLPQEPPAGAWGEQGARSLEAQVGAGVAEADGPSAQRRLPGGLRAAVPVHLPLLLHAPGLPALPPRPHQQHPVQVRLVSGCQLQAGGRVPRTGRAPGPASGGSAPSCPRGRGDH